MLSSRVRRLRNQLIEIQKTGISLDGATLGSIILAVLQIEDRVLDLEERFPVERSEPFNLPANVIAFPAKPRH
ncbi:hypothetical protein [Pararhizobium gei]|uniref:hypothetical protein n=1 Tax=Pararhizobium gei TaxID=1395951 RepID=UPI0023DBC0FD|nr:hypothetical protein [Rhizobium gei]